MFAGLKILQFLAVNVILIISPVVLPYNNLQEVSSGVTIFVLHKPCKNESYYDFDLPETIFDVHSATKIICHEQENI